VNPTGANLSQATSLNAEITLNIGSSALLDVRVVSGNLYLMINPSALQSIPSLPISADELSGVSALFGGRWFELPQALLRAYLKSERAKLKATGDSSSATTNDVHEEQAIVAALTKFVETRPSTSLSGGGFSETATLQALVNGLWPTIEGLAPGAITKPTSVKGSYTLTMATSGSTITGGSISITAPSTGGNDTIGLQATVTHSGATVIVPPNATVLSESSIMALLNEVK
jgi:hypothetical protein